MNAINYARLNNGKLEIHTDNATFFNGETQTSIGGKTFEISGEDLMQIYALLNDREVTHLLNVRDKDYMNMVHHYMVVGKDVGNIKIMKEYVDLRNKVEEINNTRHWWERKITID
jgi:hypothetical protein